MKAYSVAMATLVSALLIRESSFVRGGPFATANPLPVIGSRGPAPGWTVDAVPITTIGGDESDPQQHFVYINLAQRYADGRVVVAAGGETRLFAADGRFLKTISKAGEGPGEFRDVSHMILLPGDTLMLADNIGRKVAYYDRTGKFVRQEQMDMARWDALGSWLECYTDVLPDRTRIGCLPDPSIPRSSSNRPDVHGDPGPGRLRMLRRLYVVPPTLTMARPIGIDAGIEQFGVKTPRGTRFYEHPFYGSSHVAAGGTPLRIAVATNPEYKIEIWTPQGKLERIITRPGGRRAPSAADKRDMLAMMQQTLKGWHDTANPARVLSEIPTPDSLPAIAGLAVGPSGEILAQRDGWFPSQNASAYDVFDATGTFVGTLRLPRRTRVLQVGRDFLLVMRLDADDVPLVEVYRLHRQA